MAGKGEERVWGDGYGREAASRGSLVRQEETPTQNVASEQGRGARHQEKLEAVSLTEICRQDNSGGTISRLVFSGMDFQEREGLGSMRVRKFEQQSSGEQAYEKPGEPGTVEGLLRSVAMKMAWYQPAMKYHESLAALSS